MAAPATNTRNVITMNGPGTYDKTTTSLLQAGVLGRFSSIDCYGGGGAAITITLFSGQDSTVTVRTCFSAHVPANQIRTFQFGLSDDTGVLHFDNGLSGIIAGAGGTCIIYWL